MRQINKLALLALAGCSFSSGAWQFEQFATNYTDFETQIARYDAPIALELVNAAGEVQAFLDVADPFLVSVTTDRHSFRDNAFVVENGKTRLSPEVCELLVSALRANKNVTISVDGITEVIKSSGFKGL